MQVAAQEARRFRHAHVDTEHVLLGLIGSGGRAADVLASCRLHPATVAMEVEKSISWGASEHVVEMPLRTTAVDTAIERAIDEARCLDQGFVGTEHLLLGLIREENGLAARVLASLGLTIEEVRAEILKNLSKATGQAHCASPTDSDRRVVSDADRGFFLALYRSAVDFYKPKIEKRTGVLLGDIAVRDYSCLHQDVLDQLRRQASPWLVGVVRSLILRRRLRLFAKGYADVYAGHARKCSASYYKSAIYVSFSSGTSHEEAVAAMAVHELSHALWERLEGEPLDVMWMKVRRLGRHDIESYKLLVEGYATYAERIWFADVYPSSVRDGLLHHPLQPESNYARGLDRIKELVRQHGPEILLEIPKRWRTYLKPPGESS
jgi:hypothetical protein